MGSELVPAQPPKRRRSWLHDAYQVVKEEFHMRAADALTTFTASVLSDAAKNAPRPRTFQTTTIDEPDVLHVDSERADDRPQLSRPQLQLPPGGAS